MPPKWRLIQKENFTSIHALLDYLNFSEENRKLVHDRPPFVLNLPRRLAAKIAKNTPEDPLFRQFIPLLDETIIKPGFIPDALQETTFLEGKKLFHKYHNRALLLVTGACAMHCRYCFRQHFAYDTQTLGYDAELSYVKQNPSISELILSGGDPLSLSNESLKNLLLSISQIPHILRIRFHTRFPLGIPERIDNEFLEILATIPQQLFVVIHCNHPKELDIDVKQALKKIMLLGIVVLNQSVLLKGVNDCEETFLQLNEELANAGIIPYYLHLLDPVERTSHFEVSEKRGHELIQYAQEHTSGFAVPKLVREIPGTPSKTLLHPVNCL